MKRMKRLICLLTVLCMVVSMAGFTAFAEGALIGTVTFEGTLPTVVAGQEAPEVTGITCSQLAADYNIAAEWEGIAEGEQFEKAYYRLNITLLKKHESTSTATFADEIVVNGLGDSEYSITAMSTEQLVVSVDYDLHDKIVEAQVNGVPVNAENGDSAALNITAPENVPYTVETVLSRYDADAEEYVPYTAATYQKGNYLLRFELEPDAGYCFTKAAEEALLINGGSVDDIYPWTNDGILYFDYYFYVKGEPITEASVNGVPTSLAVGDSTAVKLTVPENAPYTADLVWSARKSDTWEEYTDATFKSGVYEAAVILTAEEGFGFSEETLESITVNGELTENWNAWDDCVCLYFDYDLRPEITLVELSGIPTAEVGKTADISGIKIPENANYTMNACWIDYENQEPFSGTFENKLYLLRVDLVSKENMRFADEVKVFADGIESDMFDAYSDEIYYYQFVDLREQVVQVEVNNIPSLTLGEKIPTPEVKVPENTNYEILYQEWSRENGDTFETVEKDAYTLRIAIAIKDGAFVNEMEGVSVKVDGELLLGTLAEEAGWNYYVNDSSTLIIEKIYDTRDVINTVEITGVPAIGEGKSMDASGVKIPENVNYELVDAWFSGFGGEEEKFQAGYTYDLRVDLIAKEGHRFSEDLLATVDGGYWDEVNVYGAHVLLSKHFEIADNQDIQYIDKVELTDIPAFEAGKEVDLSKIKIPEDANYVLSVAELRDVDNWNTVVKLEEGRAYRALIELEAKEGYQFAEYVDIYVNGELADRVWANGSWAHYEDYISFKKQIQDIQLTNAADAKIGETAVTTGVTAAEGTTVEKIQVQWKKWDYDRSIYVDFEGTFEAGNVYARDITVWIPEDSELIGDVYVNGVAAEAIESAADSHTFRQEFSLENKEITSVNLVITPPEIGKPFNQKNIQVDTDAHCFIRWKDWYSYGDKDYWSNVFDKDTLYSADLQLTPEDGYVFAEDVKVTVNGKNADVHVAGITCITLDLWSFFDTTIREDGTVAVRDDKIYDLIMRVPEDATEVTLDLSGMEKSSVKVEIPAESFEMLELAEMNLTIVTDTATVTLDQKVVEALLKNAEEDSIVTLEVKYIESAALTEKQQSALNGKKVAGVISAELLLDGKPLSDFGGGNVTIQIPFTPDEGTSISGYTLWYLADDGSFTEQKALFANGKITTVMAHFSEYVVLYTPPAANPSTGDEFPAVAFAAIAIMSILGVAVVVLAKKRSVR